MTDLNIEAPDLTPTEGKLAQAYVETMDFVSRCAQALEDGDWDYLADKACQLRNAANALEAAADVAKAATPTPRTAAVLSAVTNRGSTYRAIEVLHPGPFRTAR
ncbi:hypothetical protein [Salinispora arenicola]|uniref:hypothetical protein n=1 Tax=Salinispora arenicola TaxID=168697 RepID=UPI000379DB1E|nr:hypothetical protein [Salinispora arenicola]